MKNEAEAVEYISDEMIENQANIDLAKYIRLIGADTLFPIYADEIIKKLWNIHVEYTDDVLDKDGQSVLASYYPELKKVVLSVRENENKGRCSFSIAHEMGHVSLHSFIFNAMKKHSPKNCSMVNININPEKIEQQANKYATALLMPKAEVISLLKKMGCTEKTPVVDMSEHSSTLKEHFGGSNEALEYRLGNLGFKVINGLYVYRRKRLKESLFLSDTERENWTWDARA